MSIAYNFFLVTKDEYRECDELFDHQDDIRYEQAIEQIFCWPIAGNLSDPYSSFVVNISQAVWDVHDSFSATDRDNIAYVMARTVALCQGGLRQNDLSEFTNLWTHVDAFLSILGPANQERIIKKIDLCLEIEYDNTPEALLPHLAQWKRILTSAIESEKYLVIYGA